MKKKPVYSIDALGRRKDYSSIMEASKKTGCATGNINRCFRGKIETSLGLRWYTK